MLTVFIIISVIVFLIAYDAFAYRQWGREYTISLIMHHWGQEWGLLPYIVAFAAGALFGHMFYPVGP